MSKMIRMLPPPNDGWTPTMIAARSADEVRRMMAKYQMGLGRPAGGADEWPEPEYSPSRGGYWSVLIEQLNPADDQGVDPMEPKWEGVVSLSFEAGPGVPDIFGEPVEDPDPPSFVPEGLSAEDAAAFRAAWEALDE